MSLDLSTLDPQKPLDDLKFPIGLHVLIVSQIGEVKWQRQQVEAVARKLDREELEIWAKSGLISQEELAARIARKTELQREAEEICRTPESMKARRAKERQKAADLHNEDARKKRASTTTAKAKQVQAKKRKAEG